MSSGTTSTGLGASNNNVAIFRLQFSNDAVSTISATISRSSIRGAYTNSGVAGYFLGDEGGTITNINKLTFSGETRSIISAGLTNSGNPASFSNSGTAGYNMSVSSTLDKLTYSNDTMSTTSVNSTYPSGGFGGTFSNSGTAGYGGNSGGAAVQIYKLLFSNDTVSYTSSNMYAAVSSSTGLANSGTAGYFAGGTASSVSISVVQKVTFSTDTRTNLGSVLSSTRFVAAGLQNKGVAGYIGSGGSTTGGYNYAVRTDYNKLAYSNETTSAFGSLTLVRGVGTSNEGSI
jgi:hypothetical protein